ncbi:hypothetical protein BDN70DRAFT_885400 [Pholiota conissans]|uniref:Uncharacterized protein n=1 Tax=Pholiota conissans TaxID=109636 RepID=A0A9P6CPG1_9AGAR|nr:hypothetical protein BDN70DRAFT_885400 [Pholiota conissans]
MMIQYVYAQCCLSCHSNRAAYFSSQLTTFSPYDLPSVAEALASPVKYAIFEVLGYEFIRAMAPFCVSSCVPGSLASSASIGALGGGVLTAVHLSLSLKRLPALRDDSSNLYILAKSLFQALWKESVFSLFAALIGAAMSGITSSHGLSCAAAAGVFGPSLALAVMFGVLGVIIAVAWSRERLKDFFSRY